MSVSFFFGGGAGGRFAYLRRKLNILFYVISESFALAIDSLCLSFVRPGLMKVLLMCFGSQDSISPSPFSQVSAWRELG